MGTGMDSGSAVGCVSSGQISGHYERPQYPRSLREFRKEMSVNDCSLLITKKLMADIGTTENTREQLCFGIFSVSPCLCGTFLRSLHVAESALGAFREKEQSLKF